MKIPIRFLLLILIVATVLLTACAGAATAEPNVGAGKVEPIPVAFTGMVQSTAGDQWVINDQTVTVDPAVVRDGPFIAGDQVKVEGAVQADGSFTVSRVERPTAEDLATLPQFGVDSGNDNSSNANSNEVNLNDDIGNDGNSNDDNSNSANSNDDNGNADNSNDANANDDNGNDANANDDNGSQDNSNADDSAGNTNDDSSSNGDDGGDDNGGNGNGG